ncbi:FUSC family protein [Methylopila sp. M107]|uniref:FUSC family protein n=1 Tax=Methylopila sp. M107 TaxID=1101190 RepID=UPI00037ACE4F|nr:FUSC family protein [Methylopila sp. M107]
MSPAATQKLVFALRTTLAGLLAAWIAFTANLPQASTSMMTVFIVSQPLTGMVLSKSLFRVVGTVTGAVVAVALTALFSEAPELFALAVSLWIGSCVAVAVFMRDAPAGYGALLSGYTVAIVALPAVGAPDTVFQAAMDRGAEIFVGIMVATTLSQVFFPQSAAGALKRATSAAVASASAWAAETLKGRPDAEKVSRDRRKLVADVSRLENLRIHASFDSAEIRLSGRRVRLLHARLVSLLALLVSVHDRMETLRAERPDSAARLRPLMAQAADAMAPEASEAKRSEARDALLGAAPDLDAMRTERAGVFERTILLRVADLVDMRGDIARLSDPAGGAVEIEPVDADDALSRYRDVQLSLVSGATAFTAMLVIQAFWIASAWTSGAGAAVMVAVMTSLFAQADDPSRPAHVFLVMTAIGSLAAGIYVFGILPGLEGFETLALVLSPLLFAAAYAMATPTLALPALAGAIGAINLLSLTNVMTPDFETFANAAIGQMIGIGGAAVLLRILRPIGAAWPVARLTAGLSADLADVAAGRESGRLAFESRMFDRIDGLMTRLDLADTDNVAVEQGALAAVRVGLNMLALRRVVRDLPAEVSGPVVEALAELARHFRRLARRKASAPPFGRLDAALDASLGADLPAREGAADLPVWIASIRMALAQHPRLFGDAASPVEPKGAAA